jgi:hypothetical protein
MRHFLLALMIALLPVRGWMGDAMAMALVTHHGSATLVSAATTAAEHHAAATEPSHCAGHAEHAVQGHVPHDIHHGVDDHHAVAGESPHQHTACDVCNGPAMAQNGVQAITLPQQHSVQLSRAVPFASTVLPQGIKPPIS